jgi:hypothetical protein
MAQAMSRGERKAIITRDHPGMSLSRQCRYRPVKSEAAGLKILGKIKVKQNSGAGGVQSGDIVCVECHINGFQ